MSSGNTKRQIQLLQDFGTTLLICTPTYAMYMAEVAEAQGVDLRKLPIRMAMVGGRRAYRGAARAASGKWGMMRNGKLWPIRGDGAGRCGGMLGEKRDAYQ